MMISPSYCQNSNKNLSITNSEYFLLLAVACGVEKGTKIDNSYRKLSLPPTIVRMFTEWREELRAKIKRRNKCRKIVSIDAPVWLGEWVFPQAKDTAGHPHSFTVFLRRFCTNNKLPSASPHLFRHMAGSYLLCTGIDIATISG
jgi:integrase